MHALGGPMSRCLPQIGEDFRIELEQTATAMSARDTCQGARSTLPMHRAGWLTSLAVVVIAASLMLSTAEAEAPVNVRVALVIGNAAYVAAPLVNSTNDALAMARVLLDLGFQVIEVNDASKAQMASGIESARRALNGKHGVAMFYYAGHAMQLDWHNYMIPVDAKLLKAEDVPLQTVDVDAVMAAFKAANTRMNILVLDACRDNPYEGAASGKGLAPLDAPPGTFLAYATAPGNVARDGTEASGHGLYTEYLIEELEKPEAKIEDVFKRVRTKVRQQSHGRQIPWGVHQSGGRFPLRRRPRRGGHGAAGAGGLEARRSSNRSSRPRRPRGFTFESLPIRMTSLHT